ncbi:MAG TPA: serine/threonine-protein kinase [Polyangiaceae bacterium]|nr:serine/threonine-protein kinase [Polyangiaceae bacterium]
MPEREAPGETTQRASWRARRTRLIGRLTGALDAPLDSRARAEFEQELADTNRRRLLALLPFMMVAHAIHTAIFHVSTAERAELAPHIVRWRDGVAAAHGATLVVAGVLSLALWRFGKRRAGRWLGPATAATYLVHGAVVAGIDQLSVNSVTPFVGYCVGAAVVVYFTPAVALLVYAVGLATFVPAIVLMQPSASTRLAELPNGFTAFLSVVMAWVLYVARRRDFLQRRTIDEQRAALAELNVGLERRVGEQVAEIVQRAREVEELNAQLAAKVRERSTELSIALAKLAEQNTDRAVPRGLVLGDRFEIKEMLGAGGMGAVYSAIDRTNRARVAVKVIRASTSQELDALRRFIREAGTAARIDHPAVVRMIHVDVSDDGMLFHAQELVDGITLQHRLRSGRRWEPGVIARLASVLCEALAAAHAVGVVHRDVKPSNLMLTRAAPGLKLLDFGISKLYDDAQEDDGATRTGTILGTPAYMAPEQVDGGRRVADRADVYAVGVILFLMLTGRLPFEEITRRAPLRGALRDAPDVRSFQAEAPAELADLVARCLERDPEDRPSARELARELSTFADREGVGSLDTLERAGRLQFASSVQPPETLAEARQATPA